MTSRTIDKVVMRGDKRVHVFSLPLLCFQIGQRAASQELLRDRYGLPREE
jgi:hypothetical protein